MRFVTFSSGEGERLGVIAPDDGRVIDLAATAQALGVPCAAPDMIGLIEGGEPAVDEARRVISARNDQRVAYDPKAIRLRAPIPRPAKNIFCVGLNYVDHNSEFQGRSKPLPEHPIFFTKPATSVIGPDATINPHTGVTSELDYEVELAVVIGRHGRDILPEHAWDYVFGYTGLNDITARDLQRRHAQWFIGKSLDTFCPMGPEIVLRDSVAVPPALSVVSRVNGEVRQNANTRDLIFDIPCLISVLSAGHTLEPGDIIATGTPAGVGLGFDPPRFLKSGDVVEIEIEGIGVLRNEIG
ncbi:fumarylacetoacetate hydrolase family protein [Rhodospirillaceae bacterium SYSU D60014]|uniref:fumarylacetoacetate hydrolase family protein n=1 Tax=Virgifigura deserti TaxID=2268457 RepID=UPI0013C4DD66